MKKIKMEIVKLRKRDGLTQQQLAEKLGVSYQTISKWENGTSLPDISMLPYISECFQVSVDEILGLKPLESDTYESKGTSQSNYWNEKLDYLQHSRLLMWNDDYLEFLIQNVWKINKPVNIIDFGCGYGYLGTKIMPILPNGSTYTGIDINEDLIGKAKEIFQQYNFKSEFIISDLNTYTSVDKYDIAICQAFLRHVPNPREILFKMIDSVKDCGMVACIEVNRSIENSGLCIKGLDFHEFEQTTVLQRVWKIEFESEGRDYKIGMKIPFYMKELGLKNIDSRINDKVIYINPENSFHDRQLNAFLKTMGLEKPKSSEEIETVASLLMNRGINRAEVESYLKTKETVYSFIQNDKTQSEIVHTFGLLITYGWK